jgi:hypothetical protein
MVTDVAQENASQSAAMYRRVVSIPSAELVGNLGAASTHRDVPLRRRSMPASGAKRTLRRRMSARGRPKLLDVRSAFDDVDGSPSHPAPG